MAKPEQSLFDWNVWDHCQAGLWDVYNRLCVDWGEKHEKYSLAPPTYAKACKKMGAAVWTGYRSTKSFRTGCFKMHFCKLEYNLNIITRGSEVLSSQWVLSVESALKQTLLCLQQFLFFQPCTFWIGFEHLKFVLLLC